MSMGMGMMGMQGGQQRAAPMKDQPAAELREDQVQEAIASLENRRSARKSCAKVKAYLSQHMGLTSAELAEVMDRSG